VLPEHVAADPDLKQRFELEAKTVAALNHSARSITRWSRARKPFVARNGRRESTTIRK
jgi:hypothetical protein